MGSYGHYYVDPDVASVRWRVEGAPSKVVIAFTYLFVASYAPTWGPAGWVYAPEVFPNHLRAKGMGVAAASNWTYVLLVPVDRCSNGSGLIPRVASRFNFALAWFVPPSFENIQWRTCVGPLDLASK